MSIHFKAINEIILISIQAHGAADFSLLNNKTKLSDYKNGFSVKYRHTLYYNADHPLQGSTFFFFSLPPFWGQAKFVVCTQKIL